MSATLLWKVLVVFGTRPEAIKLAPVILALKADPRFLVSVCASGQHRDMTGPICDIFDIRIDHDLDIMLPGQTIDHVTGAILERLPAVFRAIRPDMVIVQGDTTTAFAAALSAFYHKIRVAHVEAGLRTHNLLSPWPEEGNRALIGQLADFHFPPTQASYDNLVQANARGQLMVTGNTVVDAAHIACSKITKETERKIALRLGIPNDGRPVILFTMHRRESFGKAVEAIFQTLVAIARAHDVAILFPVHPNPNISDPAQRILGTEENIHLLRPLAYDEMIVVLKNARMLITDSGGLVEEAATFGTPALILRENTERPESIETGGACLIGYDTDRLMALVQELLAESDLYKVMRAAKNPFGDGHASSRIVKVLADGCLPLAEAA